MREVREFVVDGSPVYVEIIDDDESTEYSLVSRSSKTDTVTSMDTALGTVKPAAEKLMQTINELVIRPREVEVEFGIKLSGKVGALIASTSTEGHFNIKLKWAPPG